MTGSAGFEPFTFRVLGPLEIRRGDVVVPMTLARMPQRLLVALLFDAPAFVPVTRLDERVFGRPNRDSRQKYVSRIRGRLRPDGLRLLQERDSSHRLDVDPTAIDMTRFRAGVDRGKAEAGRDDEAAIASLTAALALWSGEALHGLGGGTWMEVKRQGLVSERREATLLLLRIKLRAGSPDALPEVARFFSDNPGDEDAAALYMVASYADGDVPQSLNVFQIHANHVRQELNAEPSERLRALRNQIGSRRLDLGSWLGARPVATGGSTPEPPPRPAGPRHLPPALPEFIGRRAEIIALDRAAGSGAIIVIDGSPGVGKSVLAVHWAHRVAENYPDGQLSLNLRGFDPGGEPMGEAEALRRLLTELGVRPRAIEPDPADRADQYHAEVANRRILMLLDNAASAEQVRPLIPASEGSLVVVTSRGKLPGLGVSHQARFVPLSLPDEAEARNLFLTYLGPRATESPGAIDRIVQWSGRMPLALAIVGASAVNYPDRSLGEIFEQLRSGIATGADGDPKASVGAALACSYRYLSEADRRTFRLLGLHPGPELEVRAVAALAAVDPAAAARSLARLSAVRLIEESGSRYTLHDLVHEYAAATLTEDAAGRRAATQRLLDFHLHSGDGLATLLREGRQPMRLDPPAPGVLPVSATTEADAIAWFRSEYAVLMRLIQAAGDLGFPAYAWKILTTMIDFLDWQGHWAGWRDASKAAADAAERARDRPGVARATRSMGRAYVQSGQYEEGGRLLRDALAMYRDLGDPDGRMRVHHDLGDLLIRQEDYSGALRETGKALDLARLARNEHEEANCLNGIAWCHLSLGDLAMTVEFATAAIRILERIQYARGEAAARDTLGVALDRLGEYEAARASLRRSAELCHRVGDRFSEAVVLDHLGDCLARTDRAEALPPWRSAWAILTELNHPLAAAVERKLNGTN